MPRQQPPPGRRRSSPDQRLSALRPWQKAKAKEEEAARLGFNLTELQERVSGLSSTAEMLTNKREAARATLTAKEEDL